jgi:uncharacterized protein (TIRG00374 family)
MRKFLIAVAILFGIYFVLTRLANVRQVVATLQHGDWRWLALAILVHLTWMVNFGATFRAIYRLLGMEEDVLRLMMVTATANFFTVVTPSAGMGGIAVFMTEARERKLPAGRVTAAAALFVLYDYLGALIVLALGLIVLIRRQQLDAADIGASIILALYALALAVVLYLGTRADARLGNLLAWAGRGINRALRPFLHHDYLDIRRAHGFAHDISDGLQNARQSPGALMLPAALSLNGKALMICMLFLMFMAFGIPFSVGTLIAGFSIAFLFTIVSPTPSGIGIVEGVMTLALNSLHVPLAPAAVITLAYRGYTIWLTLIYGLIAIRWIGKPGPAEA